MKNFTSSESLHRLFQTFKLSKNGFKFKLISSILFLFISFLLQAQPTKTGAVTLESTLRSNSEDWPVSMFMSSDCTHNYFAGWTIFDDQNGCPDGNNMIFQHPIVGKINIKTNKLIWEKEYLAIDAADGLGQFDNVWEDGNIIVATGKQNKLHCGDKWSIILKANAETGEPLPGYPKLMNYSNQALGLSLFGVSYYGINFFPIIENGQITGMIGSGAGNVGGKTKAVIIVMDKDGNPDPSFGNGGYYIGEEGTVARGVIKFKHDGVDKYAFTGWIEVGHHDGIEDVYASVLSQSGAKLWSEKYSEDELMTQGKYVDVQINDASACASVDIETHNESGWDILQNGDYIYLGCYFDKISIDKYSPCPELGDISLRYDDLAILKVEISNGEVEKAINVGACEAPDYYAKLELKDGEIYMLGAKSRFYQEGFFPNILKADGYFATFDLNLQNRSERTFEVDNWNINCSFDIGFDCEGNIIISGDNELNHDDYYFYTFSKNCQNKITYSGDDIITPANISIATDWNTSRKIKATVTVESGATLTVNNSTLQFGASWELVDYDILSQNDPTFDMIPKIVVKNGGTLILNGSILKGLNACNQDWMWDGIEAHNGSTVIINGSTIQDAKIGVLVDKAKYSSAGRIIPSESDGGGTLNMINGSIILNCYKGIHFAPCIGNTSNISNSHFLCDAFLKDYSYYQCSIINIGQPCVYMGIGTPIFVSANQAKGMTFTGSTWLNTLAIPHELKGIGINSFGSKYSVNSNSTMTGLQYGIKAFGGADPKATISVLDNNVFSDNIVGILFGSGEGNAIRNGNQFNLSGYVNQLAFVPMSIGVSNFGSLRNVYEDENAFIQPNNVPSNFLSLGIVSENTTSSSFHQKNTFTYLTAGEQVQKDNTGLQMYCNTHTIRDNAWKIYGLIGDQGNCGSQAPITPNEKFQIICQPSQNNHIDNENSSNIFKYYTKTSDQNPPMCNLNVDLNNCPNLGATDGCDFLIPKITGGNVDGFQTQVNNMGDGQQKTAIVDQLIQYYLSNNNIEAADNLLSSQVGIHYSMTRALVQLNYGSVLTADIIVNSMPSSNVETQDFTVYYNVLKSAKLAETALWNLDSSAVISLQSIAENRTLGAYAAQAILSFYYGIDYTPIIETSTNQQSQSSQSLKQKESNKFNNLGTITSQRDRIQIELNEEISDKALNLQIINFDGKLVRSLDLEKGKKQMQVSISQLNPGNYIAILKEGQKLISKAIILKQ